MLGDQGANSHWHDHEYQLDPHRLQVSESPRQRGMSSLLLGLAQTLHFSVQLSQLFASFNSVFKVMLMQLRTQGQEQSQHQKHQQLRDQHSQLEKVYLCSLVKESTRRKLPSYAV